MKGPLVLLALVSIGLGCNDRDFMVAMDKFRMCTKSSKARLDSTQFCSTTNQILVNCASYLRQNPECFSANETQHFIDALLRDVLPAETIKNLRLEGCFRHNFCLNVFVRK